MHMLLYASAVEESIRVCGHVLYILWPEDFKFMLFIYFIKNIDLPLLG